MIRDEIFLTLKNMFIQGEKSVNSSRIIIPCSNNNKDKNGFVQKARALDKFSLIFFRRVSTVGIVAPFRVASLNQF